MILFNRSQFWRRTRVAALCVVAVAVAVVAWWVLGERPAHDSLPHVASPAQFDEIRAGAAAASGVQDMPVQSHVRPPDFSEEEWGALKEAMQRTDQPEAELSRVVAYLRFQKRFDRWQSLLDSPDVGSRRQLASTLVEQLPDRLKAGEVSMGEAQLLLSAFWSDLEPDEGRRRLRVEEGVRVLQAVAARSGGDQARRDAGQLTEYKRREAAILLEYQSLPEGQRDPSSLEAQLEDARRAVYGGN